MSTSVGALALMSSHFWLTDERMARLRPFFPKSNGMPRADERRFPSGMILINCNGLRRQVAYRKYGPPKTLCNRWMRWGDKGVFVKIMEGLPTRSASSFSARDLPPRRSPGRPVSSW
jgi:transposase